MNNRPDIRGLQSILPLRVLSMFLMVCSCGPQSLGQLESLLKESGEAIYEIQWVDAEANPFGPGRVVSRGTAFAIAPGRFITNWHVAAADMGIAGELTGVIGAERLKASDGRVWIIHPYVLWASRRDDLVILSILKGMRLTEDGTPHMESIPESHLEWTRESPEPGSRIAVVGFPLGIGQTISDGLLSVVHPDDQDHPALQISVPVSPGSSGSPVFYKDVVFGVVVSSAREGQQVNFAVSLDRLPNDLSFAGEDHESMNEWASRNTTRSEERSIEPEFQHYQETVRSLMESARSENSPYLEGFQGDPTEVEAPIRLRPDSDSLPELPYAAPITILGMANAAELLNRYERAAKLAGSGVTDRKLLHWAAAFTEDEQVLDAARAAWPEDDAIAWLNLERQASEVFDAFRGSYLSAEMIARFGENPVAAGMSEQSTIHSSPEKIRACLKYINAMRENNPEWDRFYEFKTANGYLLLASGQIEPAMKQLLGKRLRENVPPSGKFFWSGQRVPGNERGRVERLGLFLASLVTQDIIHHDDLVRYLRLLKEDAGDALSSTDRKDRLRNFKLQNISRDELASIQFAIDKTKP